MSAYLERKAQRTETYRRFVHGWKLEQCVSCMGSGRYDSFGAPPCSACDGTGRVRQQPAPQVTAKESGP